MDDDDVPLALKVKNVKTEVFLSDSTLVSIGDQIC